MKYINTSDIHLGHKNTPTAHIIQSFNTHILNDKNKDIDVLFIAGDLFDNLLYFNTKEVHQCIPFLHGMLEYCWINEIILIILEGTPFHDWHQAEMLVRLNSLRKNPVKLYYHRKLDIQYLAEFQKHILFVPDEWVKTQEELETQVNAKLQEHGIDKVDMAILHGQCRYQLMGRPSSAFTYDEAYLLNLVRGFIHIGHYHAYSEFDRIKAGGSLERLAHGEEHPKGYVRVENGVASFIENTDAYTYMTVKITEKTTQKQLDKIIYGLRPGSHVRLLMDPSSPFALIFGELKLRYLDYHLKKLVKGDAMEDSTVAYITTDEALEFVDNAVLETNIYDALMTIVNAKYTFTPSEHSKLLAYAEVFKTPLQGDVV